MGERFQLLELLGSGGMGDVWKARDTTTGDLVALKLVHQHLARDPDYLARFEREVEVARRIDSPYVVRVLGYGRREGVPYMAMELVEGPSLRDVIHTRGALPEAQVRRLGAEVAQALDAAHRAHVIHRDVKPSNILMMPDGSAKLADFGIARALDATRLTGSATTLGTPAYMAPDGEASVQSDLYSLGCVLYEALTGTPPFTGDSQQQVILKHVRDAPDLSRISDPGWRLMFGQLLAKDPDARPRNARTVAEALGGTQVTEGPIRPSPAAGRTDHNNAQTGYPATLPEQDRAPSEWNVTSHTAGGRRPRSWTGLDRAAVVVTTVAVAAFVLGVAILGWYGGRAHEQSFIAFEVRTLLSPASAGTDPKWLDLALFVAFGAATMLTSMRRVAAPAIWFGLLCFPFLSIWGYLLAWVHELDASYLELFVGGHFLFEGLSYGGWVAVVAIPFGFGASIVLTRNVAARAAAFAILVCAPLNGFLFFQYLG